jgi:hypothetical protein
LVKLTDTQLILLAAAANRDGGPILPLPGKLKLNRETAEGVLKELLKKKLVAERPATGPATVWHDSKAGGPVTLAITPAGLRAIAAEATAPRPGDHPKAKAAARTAKRTAPKPGRSPSRNSDGRKARPNSAALAGLRPGSKQAKLLALLQDPTGASAPTKPFHDPTNEWMFVRKDALVSAMAAACRPKPRRTPWPSSPLHS